MGKEKRVSSAPDVPTMSGAGVPGFELSTWFAIFLPANAPREVAAKLADLCNRAMGTQASHEFLRKIGYDAFPGSPESLARFVETETAKWGRLIRAAGIQPE